jgi:hypothetical protein
LLLLLQLVEHNSRWRHRRHWRDRWGLHPLLRWRQRLLLMLLLLRLLCCTRKGYLQLRRLLLLLLRPLYRWHLQLTLLLLLYVLRVRLPALDSLLLLLLQCRGWMCTPWWQQRSFCW